MPNKHNIDINFFPGWTRKSVTFSIDDGNFKLDKKFLEIMRPAGSLGTFNLVTSFMSAHTPDEFRELYEGYEIANHCKYHPLAMNPELEYKISDEPFDKETSDPNYIYKTEIAEGLYWHKRPGTEKWLRVADDEAYKRFTTLGREELEEIFGKGTIRGFCWPFHMQKNPGIHAWLKTPGYQSIRRSICRDASFSLPEDRAMWCINSWYSNLPDTAEAYDKLEDDGNLKFYCLGTHSHDFENIDRWDLAEAVANILGNRPDDFFYAGVSVIFDYEDAIKAAVVTDTEIINNSDLELYVKVDGEKVKIPARATYKLG